MLTLLDRLFRSTYTIVILPITKENAVKMLLLVTLICILHSTTFLPCCCCACFVGEPLGKYVNAYTELIH